VGAHPVDWQPFSTEDGHALEGNFSFGVRAASVGRERAVEQSRWRHDGWLQVLLRGLLYVATLLFVAALVLPRLVGRGVVACSGGARRRRARCRRTAPPSLLSSTPSGRWAATAAVGVTSADLPTLPVR
jgi:hypothetical protein